MKDLIQSAQDKKYTDFEAQAKAILGQKIATSLEEKGYFNRLGQAQGIDLSEAKNITLDIDWVPEGDDKEEAKLVKSKYKVTIKRNGHTPSSADITGKKDNILMYMQSDWYGMDDEDLKDLYPELF